MVGEKFEIYSSQLAKHALKLSTMFGENFGIHTQCKYYYIMYNTANYVDLPFFLLSFILQNTIIKTAIFFWWCKNSKKSGKSELFFL